MSRKITSVLQLSNNLVVTLVKLCVLQGYGSPKTLPTKRWLRVTLLVWAAPWRVWVNQRSSGWRMERRSTALIRCTSHWMHITGRPSTGRTVWTWDWVPEVVQHCYCQWSEIKRNCLQRLDSSRTETSDSMKGILKLIRIYCHTICQISDLKVIIKVVN